VQQEFTRNGSRPKRTRDPYPECCVAARQALARAGRQRPRLSAVETRTLMAVIDLTAHWSFLHKDEGVREVARLGYGVDRDELTRTQRQRTSEALHELDRLGIIEYEPGRGRYSRARIALPLDYQEVDSMHPSEGVTEGSGQSTPILRRKARRSCDAKHPHSAATPGIYRGSSPSIRSVKEGEPQSEQGKIAARLADHFGQDAATFLPAVEDAVSAGLELPFVSLIVNGALDDNPLTSDPILRELKYEAGQVRILNAYEGDELREQLERHRAERDRARRMMNAGAL
jgi:hypothetical protein